MAGSHLLHSRAWRRLSYCIRIIFTGNHRQCLLKHSRQGVKVGIFELLAHGQGAFCGLAASTRRRQNTGEAIHVIATEKRQKTVAQLEPRNGKKGRRNAAEFLLGRVSHRLMSTVREKTTDIMRSSVSLPSLSRHAL